jgi:hypothetical protein
MLVEFGNVAPRGSDGKRLSLDKPCVTTVNIPDNDNYGFDEDVDIEELRQHVNDSVSFNEGITNRPGHEALLAIVHPGGVWGTHSAARPSWVECDDTPMFAAALGEYFRCPVGKPDDVHETHYSVVPSSAQIDQMASEAEGNADAS